MIKAYTAVILILFGLALYGCEEKVKITEEEFAEINTEFEESLSLISEEKMWERDKVKVSLIANKKGKLVHFSIPRLYLPYEPSEPLNKITLRLRWPSYIPKKTYTLHKKKFLKNRDFVWKETGKKYFHKDGKKIYIGLHDGSVDVSVTIRWAGHAQIWKNKNVLPPEVPRDFVQLNNDLYFLGYMISPERYIEGRSFRKFGDGTNREISGDVFYIPIDEKLWPNFFIERAMKRIKVDPYFQTSSLESKMPPKYYYGRVTRSIDNKISITYGLPRNQFSHWQNYDAEIVDFIKSFLIG